MPLCHVCRQAHRAGIEDSSGSTSVRTVLAHAEEARANLLDVRGGPVLPEVGFVVVSHFRLQGLAPKAALKVLAEHLRADGNKRKWGADARVAAVLGSCPRTLGSMRSGLRNYLGYCEVALGSREAGFPPTIDVFLGWSHTHRCVGTFSNLCGPCLQCVPCRRLRVPID